MRFLNISDQIAEWLHEKKITHAYGVIGAGNIALWNAIQKAGKVALICCHHEQAAAMASGSHNRITGTLSSIVLVTTGAGSTNAITGVMAAYMDSTPLLILSGNEASKYMYAPTRVWGVQGYGSYEMVKDCTKSAYRLIENPFHNLDYAMNKALAPRQGPVWIDCPKDYQNARV